MSLLKKSNLANNLDITDHHLSATVIIGKGH
jgi:hypothetical protein